jgi:hypothetical protein
MGDKPEDKPELPDKFYQDFVIEGVKREDVNLLMDWLKETSEKTGVDVRYIFGAQAKEILNRELGPEEAARRRKEYEEKQDSRLIEYIRYCKENGIDVHSDSGLNEL